MWHLLYDSLASLLETPHVSRRPIPAIEGLRGLAMLLVFCTHYATLIEPWMNQATATWQVATFFEAVGHAGVDLFFVLSGYLIYGGLIRRPVPLDVYWKRRIRRIYPAFTAVFVIYVAACWLVPSESKIPANFAGAAKFLAANYLLLAEFLGVPLLITVSWSLSFEMLFYLVCPLLVAGFRLRQWPSARRFMLYGTIFVGLVALGPRLLELTRMAMFLVGMAVVEIEHVAKKWMSAALAIASLASGAVVLREVYRQDLGTTWWTVGATIAFFPLVCAALRDDGPVARSFAWTPLRWFGNMSYSFFLLHGLTLKVLFYRIERSLQPPSGSWDGMFWILLPIAFIAAIVPSLVLFLLVERPLSLAQPSAP